MWGEQGTPRPSSHHHKVSRWPAEFWDSGTAVAAESGVQTRCQEEWEGRRREQPGREEAWKWWDMGSQAEARSSGHLLRTHSTAGGAPEPSEHGNQIRPRESRESTGSRRVVGFGVM